MVSLSIDTLLSMVIAFSLGRMMMMEIARVVLKLHNFSLQGVQKLNKVNINIFANVV